MYLRVLDGVASFPVWLLRCAIDGQMRQKHKALRRFEVESDGIVCYSDDERQQAEAALTAAGISFTVKQQAVDPALRAKAEGIRYASRSEAVGHLASDSEPESLRIPNLAKRLATMETARQEHETRLQTLELQRVPMIETEGGGLMDPQNVHERRIAALEAWARSMGYTG